jgi:hypothetical protein
VQQERRRIDAQFSETTEGERYLALQRQVAVEFSAADWEAFEIAEAQLGSLGVVLTEGLAGLDKGAPPV